MLVHGLGLSGALWNRVRDAFGRRLPADPRRPARRRALARASARRALARALGGRSRRGARRARRFGGRCSSGIRSGRRVALKYALERPDDVRALVLIAADAEPLEPRAAHARLGRADRGHGARGLGRRVLVEEPAVLATPRSSGSRRSSTTTGICCSRTTRRTTCASAARSHRRESLVRSTRLDRRSLRSSSSAGATTGRCPSTAASLPSDLANARVVELPDVGHTVPLEAPEATAAAVRDFLRARS